MTTSIRANLLVVAAVGILLVTGTSTVLAGDLGDTGVGSDDNPGAMREAPQIDISQSQLERGARAYFNKGLCVECHGEGGDGQGDPRSPGRAANLRETELDRASMIEIITCGIPGTRMPHFDKDAYTRHQCYGMMEADMDASQMPDYPIGTALTERDISAVADFVLTIFKGGRSWPGVPD